MGDIYIYIKQGQNSKENRLTEQFKQIDTDQTLTRCNNLQN